MNDSLQGFKGSLELLGDSLQGFKGNVTLWGDGFQGFKDFDLLLLTVARVLKLLLRCC